MTLLLSIAGLCLVARLLWLVVGGVLEAIVRPGPPGVGAPRRPLKHLNALEERIREHERACALAGVPAKEADRRPVELSAREAKALAREARRR